MSAGSDQLRILVCVCACVRDGGCFSRHGPLPWGPLPRGGLGRAWSGTTHTTPSGLRLEEAATFFAGKVLWGSSIRGFSESTVRGEGVSLLAVARAVRAHTACEQTAAVCRENADCVYFHLSLQEAGGKGEGAALRPKLASEQRRPPSGVPISTSSCPALPCPWAPSWPQPAQQEESVLGHQGRNFQPWALRISQRDEAHLAVGGEEPPERCSSRKNRSAETSPGRSECWTCSGGLPSGGGWGRDCRPRQEQGSCSVLGGGGWTAVGLGTPPCCEHY